MVSEQGYIDAAKLIGCDVAAVKAVAVVESSGGGFDPEGFPKTLFEGHWFHKLTNGKFAAENPTLSYAKWTKQFYGKTWQEEKARLAKAAELDKTSAHMSASWGMFQIMGFNFAKCGFKTIQQFVNAMCKDEDSQMTVFAEYIVNAGLADELRDQRWADFARLYNGPAFAQNKYDIKLAKAYEKAKG